MANAADELSKLNALIEDQSALIEQLYAENTAAIKSIQTLTVNNKDLIVANDKQKSRIIQLSRQIKLQKPSPRETFMRPFDDGMRSIATCLNPI